MEVRAEILRRGQEKAFELVRARRDEGVRMAVIGAGIRRPRRPDRGGLTKRLAQGCRGAEQPGYPAGRIALW